MMAQPTTAASAAAATIADVPIATATVHRVVVKSVLSGDAIIIRDKPRGGPPPEKQINISQINAPRLARRPVEGQQDSKDEPYAWEAREFLRDQCVGKEICFIVDYKVPATGREYCTVFLGPTPESPNAAELIVSEGLAEVRTASNRPNDEYLKRLNELQETARAGGKGKWSTDAAEHVRNVTWTIDDPRKFVDSLHQQKQKAVVEQVRDGSTIRVFLLPSMHYITLMMSGIKCPAIKMGEAGVQAEQEIFSEEAKFFSESRLLQRDVEVILESVSNQNFIGSVIHPRGDIAELLLKEGFAKCVDWSMVVVTGGPEKLRAAEKSAKEKKMRIWRGYEGSSAIDPKSASFQGKVTEVVMGEAVVVKKDNGELVKLWLSSIRTAKADDFGIQSSGSSGPARARQFRPLYDTPFLFEAREFLRKKLIGKRVQCAIDYIQPSQNDLPSRTMATVTIGGQNVAEALVSRGLATVVRYKQGDDNRAVGFDQLLAAEEKAKKSKKGLHNFIDTNLPRGQQLLSNLAEKDLPVVRIQDLAGDATKSKQFLPYLQRAGKMEGMVEFVASGSRVRIYVPKETCLFTFLLSGINCPKSERIAPSGSIITAKEPFGDEAFTFTKDSCLQHQVEIEVETMDRAGNFVGFLFVDGKNLAVDLVSQGLAVVHFTAERTKYFPQLKTAEEKAKSGKLRIWTIMPEPPANEEDDGSDTEDQPGTANSVGDRVTNGTTSNQTSAPERKTNFRSVVVTEVQASLKFYVQFVDQGPRLEQLMKDLRTAFDTNPPLSGAYTPRKGDLCASKFVDGQWYRAKIEQLHSKDHTADVLYIDFGNRECTSYGKLASLPAECVAMAQGAHEYSLALVKLPDDPELDADAIDYFKRLVNNKQLQLNVEYRAGGAEFVTLQIPPADGATTTGGGQLIDIGKELLSEGMVLLDTRRDPRLSKLVQQFTESQEQAKKSRMNIWRYGDFTGTEI